MRKVQIQMVLLLKVFLTTLKLAMNKVLKTDKRENTISTKRNKVTKAS